VVAVEPSFLESEEVEPVEGAEAEVHADAAGPEAVEVVAGRETSEVGAKSIDHPHHLIHPLDDVGQEASTEALVAEDGSVEEVVDFAGVVVLPEELEGQQLAEGADLYTCTGHSHHRLRPQWRCESAAELAEEGVHHGGHLSMVDWAPVEEVVVALHEVQ
jgi:hypothetical protein